MYIYNVYMYIYNIYIYIYIFMCSQPRSQTLRATDSDRACLAACTYLDINIHVHMHIYICICICICILTSIIVLWDSKSTNPMACRSRGRPQRSWDDDIHEFTSACFLGQDWCDIAFLWNSQMEAFIAGRSRAMP